MLLDDIDFVNSRTLKCVQNVQSDVIYEGRSIDSGNYRKKPDLSDV